MGADLELRDNYKKTAKDYATQNQIFEVADVLCAVAGPSIETAGDVPVAARPSPLQTSPSPYSPMSVPMSMSSLPPMGSPPPTSSPPPLPTGSTSPLPPLSPGASQQPMADSIDVPGSQASKPMPAIQPISSPATSSLVHASSHAAMGVHPGSSSVQPASEPPDIRQMGLDYGPSESEMEEKRKPKKKNDTVMRHISMIHTAPKQPYGPGRPLSRPSSGKRR